MRRKMLTRLRAGTVGAGLLSLLGIVACSGSTEPRLRPCASSGTMVSLAVAEYVSIDPATDSGCTLFPANGLLPGEFLIVPQLATGEPGKTSSFRLAGDTLRPAAVPLAESRPALSPALQFHDFLRHGDERRWRGMPLRPAATAPALPAPAARPPNYGDARQFHVRATTTRSRFQTVTATGQAVRNKVATFVDNAAPAGGLDSLALGGLSRPLGDTLFPPDTPAFGRESDIHANSVGHVLRTPW